MNFGPLIGSCIPLKMFNLGAETEGFLLHEIKSKGAIEYVFIFGVFKNKQPILYYCAERHPEKISVYIGVFDETGHKNLGVDNQAADAMSFLVKAIEYVCENCGLSRDQIVEVPPRVNS